MGTTTGSSRTSSGSQMASLSVPGHTVNTSDFKDRLEEKEFEIAVASLRTCCSMLPPVLEI